MTSKTGTREPTPAEAIRQARRRIALESVDIAISALTEVARNKSAPAPARATAGSALLRAAGLFEREADLGEKPAYQMSEAELQAKLAELEAEADEWEAERRYVHRTKDVFE